MLKIELGRPIDMGDPMVHAIKSYNKVSTMRCIPWFLAGTSKEFLLTRSKYDLNERVWVRRAWAVHKKWNRASPSKLPVEDLYVWHRDTIDSNEDQKHRGRWRQGRCMPKKIAKISLLITNISVMKVQDITDKMAYNEGVNVLIDGPTRYHLETLFKQAPKWIREVIHDLEYPEDEPIRTFAQFWDLLNFNRGFSWKMNPTVHKYDFELIDGKTYP